MEVGLLIAYAALGIMAVVPIYYGSFASVKWPKKSKQKRKSPGHETDSSSEEESSAESLSTEDAYLFPIFGSVVLFSLYLIFKLLDKEYVNYLVTAYFAFLGVVAVTNVGVHVVKSVFKLKVDAYKLVLTKKAKELYNANFTIIHLVSLFFSILLTAFYVGTKNWIASNIFGLAFAFNAIQMLSLDSFKTGMILLGGLFFYDIFWVFGTEVMVTVAKSFDAPIKVVWPKQWIGLQPDEALQFTMLGLGDIVVPGIYVALCLRFDHSNYLKKNPKASRYSIFPTPYFRNCFTAYILGLVTTIVVMHTFKAAQPALLYLSPACILSVLATGIVKNQLKDVFNYSADDAEGKGEEKKKKDTGRPKKQMSSESEGDDGSFKKHNTQGEDDNSGTSAVLTAEEEDYVDVSPTSSTSGTKKKNKKKSSKKKTS
ncbi:signal peptide peptidase-domain-containing protein [Gigaspora rosea]|uniref:Signal peptide peptidase-domain-containing protein n=1 Tax=Gigaspora rosea TaxID=44941 RepID=A0A397UL33_9GLOM|nr:signal peptide peptidase-domain-containing protein [Gigaspora rosea]